MFFVFVFFFEVGKSMRGFERDLYGYEEDKVEETINAASLFKECE